MAASQRAPLLPEREDGHPNVLRFAQKQGRLPMLGDDIAPWRFPGWLLVHRWMCEAHPGVSPRWSYHMELCSGHLPEAPIPTIGWTEAHTSHEWTAVTKQLRQCVEIACEGGRLGYGWEGFRRVVAWLGWGLGTSDRYPEEIGEKQQEQLYRLFNLGPWLLAPADYLGDFAAEKHGGGWNPHAFYPTPMALCQLKARMLMPTGSDLRLLSACDPCCGTGRLLLSAGDHCLRLYGQDIDGLMVEITKVNGALYCPWLCRPIPEDVLPALELQQQERVEARRQEREATERLRSMFALLTQAVETSPPQAPAEALQPPQEPAETVEATDIHPTKPEASTEPPAASVGTPPRSGEPAIQLTLF